MKKSEDDMISDDHNEDEISVLNLSDFGEHVINAIDWEELRQNISALDELSEFCQHPKELVNVLNLLRIIQESATIILTKEIVYGYESLDETNAT